MTAPRELAEGDGAADGLARGRPGALVLVATPIGNLGDLSPRAVAELARADAVCCEDTRRTGRLLQHAGVTARRLITVNDHTEASRIGEVLRLLERGGRVAVVSDAGTPGISDPGERLVRAVSEQGFVVEVVPGPSALVAALVASGLPTGRFAFEGFLPRKGSGRSERLAALAEEARTIVLYEAPHRVARTLADLAAALGPDRRVAVARELTKLHEEVWRGTLAEGVTWAAQQPRGELVLVVDGAPPRTVEEADLVEAVAKLLALGTPVREAAVEVAHRFGVPKRRVYELAIKERARGG